jgi:hypothetical protein
VLARRRLDQRVIGHLALPGQFLLDRAPPLVALVVAGAIGFQPALDRGLGEGCLAPHRLQLGVAGRGGLGRRAERGALLGQCRQPRRQLRLALGDHRPARRSGLDRLRQGVEPRPGLVPVLDQPLEGRPLLCIRLGLPLVALGEAGEEGCGHRRGIAQARQPRRRRRVRRLGRGGERLALAERGAGLGQGVDRGLERGAAGADPRLDEERLECPDLRLQLLVALGLLGLLLQRRAPGGEEAELVGDPLEIGGGRLQLELGLAPAAVHAADAGRLLEQAAALLGLGLDDEADLALADDRRALGTRAGVGEQELDVAGADLAPVQAVERARAAADPPADLEILGLGQDVERRRRRRRPAGA